MALTKVTTGVLADDSVTAALIADDAVGSAALADDAVGSAAIADGAVGTAALASTIAAGIPTTTVSGNANATANTHHFVSASGVTLTLPTPTVGMKVYVTVGNFDTTVLGRNSSTIVGSATDLTINVANMSIGLIGTSTSSWVFI